MLNAIALTFASGTTYFLGLALSHAALLWNPVSSWRSTRFVVDLGILLGMVLVFLSAAPLSIVVYGTWFCCVVVTRLRLGKLRLNGRRIAPAIAAVSASTFVIMFLVEAWYWRTPVLPLPAERLYVIGDSISIGADAQELNWPELLGAKLDITVHNYSFGGAKVRTALSNANRVMDGPALVILEIGGNDLLATTDAGEFARDLEELMRVVCTPQHEVVMFELPLPPFHNRYGRIQRRLAREYGVTLIPKRLFADVLATPKATVDGLHLSHTGHVHMAERVAGLFAHNPQDGVAKRATR